MVLPLLSLPAELQSIFVVPRGNRNQAAGPCPFYHPLVVLLVDVVTAGRLARACSECKELLVERLLELRKERRAAEQARNEEQRTQKRNAILGCFENIDGTTNARTLDACADFAQHAAATCRYFWLI